MAQLTADSPAVHTKQPTLTGRTAVISGGTSGIGRATAALLAAEGAHVLLFGREQQDVDATLRELGSASGRVVGTAADQARPEDVARVFATADRELGRIDILVNNAAVHGGAITEADDETWRYELHADLDGYIDCTRQAITRMRRQGGGHIVNIGSISARRQRAGSSLYVAAKSAIHGYSNALRKELAADGIKVSLIEPGMVGTGIFEDDAGVADPDRQQAMQHQGSMLKPQDIAVAVHYCLTQPERCTIGLIRLVPRT